MVKKYDSEKWKKQKEEAMQKLTDDLMKEVHKYTESPEDLLEFFDFFSKFHDYSANNVMLIRSQRSGALAVGSFIKFKELGYSVKRGQKGIKIIVPKPVTLFDRKTSDGKIISVNLKQATPEEKELIKNGKIKTSVKEAFGVGTVFDVLQTTMPKEEYPKLYPNRHQDFSVENPKQLPLIEKAIKKQVAAKNLKLMTYNPTDPKCKDLPPMDNAKGYFYEELNSIVLNADNTPTEKVAVLAHELGHAELHKVADKNDFSRGLKELQAEMTSYLVTKHYGIDTKEETLKYIADWTENGKKVDELADKEKLALFNGSTKAAVNLIKAIDKDIDLEEKKLEKTRKLKRIQKAGLER